jgi:hypothetical protein
MERVAIRLRTCTRCGHQECPCCRVDYCDTSIGQGDDFDMCPCNPCTYDETVDELGYVRLDAAIARHAMPVGTTSVDGGVIVTSAGEDPDPAVA